MTVADRRPTRAAALVAAACLYGVVAAGCSGSSGASGAAATTTPATTTPATTTAPATTSAAPTTAPTSTATPAQSSPTAAPRPPGDDRLVTFDGVGPFTFAMTSAQARAAATRAGGWRFEDGPYCSALVKGGLTLVMAEGRVLAVQVTDPAVKTDEGVGIGSSVTRLRRAYPDAETASPERVVARGPGSTSIVFHVDGAGPTAFTYLAGPRDSVEAEELCG